ncbi:radical SAM protein [Saccharopolyspora hattusasensis]|uniref:radical SAM protein n=1 Tax=Saccharopolyspora hattusasensis TaxID=1128679 RepID=UPI003D9816AD
MTTSIAMEPQEVHLVELTHFPGQRYSATLGYLQASAESLPEIAAACSFRKHIEPQTTRSWPETCRRILDSLHDPLVVAFTIYFWNRARSLELAGLIKRRWPSCRIVLGGNDVSHQQDQLFREAPWVDVLVHGEGELRFAELLRRFCCGSEDLSNIDGISFWEGRGERRELRTTRSASRIAELDTIASPILSPVFSDEDIATTSLLVYETNRGCPYHCSFCYWGGAINQKIRRFSMERITRELERVVRLLPAEALFFVADANFGILPRDREIAELFVDLCRQHDKAISFVVNWAKNSSRRIVEIAEVLHAAGALLGMTLSTQSFTPKVLELAQRSNIKTEHYREIRRMCQEKGIPTYTDLIWGMPGENYETYKDSVEEVLRVNGCPVIYHLLLLNNTEYAKETFRHEQEMLVRELPTEVGSEISAETVVGHRQMTRDEWLRGTELRFSLYLFQKTLMRATLAVIRAATGIRMVDLCDHLVDFLKEGCPDGEVAELARDHSRAWWNPADCDRELVVRTLGVEHGNFQANAHWAAVIRCLATAPDRLRAFLTGAVEHLRASSPGRLPSAAEIESALDLDVLASAELRTRLTGIPVEAEVVLPGHIYTVLREADVLQGQAHIGGGGVVTGRMRTAVDDFDSTRANNSFFYYLSGVQFGRSNPLRDNVVIDARAGT